MKIIDYCFFHLVSTYWTITLCCLALYAVDSFVNIMADKEQRSKVEQARNSDNPLEHRVYYPRITYGHLLSYFVGSFVPILNMWMILYSICPNLWNLFKGFFKFLDRPIVTPR